MFLDLQNREGDERHSEGNGVAEDDANDFVDDDDDVCIDAIDGDDVDDEVNDNDYDDNITDTSNRGKALVLSFA